MYADRPRLFLMYLKKLLQLLLMELVKLVSIDKLNNQYASFTAGK